MQFNILLQNLLNMENITDLINYRSILLRKMEYYSVKGNIHLLISKCLDGRKQFVSFKGYESTCEKIEVWVPQGSVIGPLIFLIHINDLQKNTSLLASSTLQMKRCFTKHSQKTHTHIIVKVLIQN